jgi:hypothetical protein
MLHDGSHFVIKANEAMVRVDETPLVVHTFHDRLQDLGRLDTALREYATAASDIGGYAQATPSQARNSAGPNASSIGRMRYGGEIVREQFFAHRTVGDVQATLTSDQELPSRCPALLVHVYLVRCCANDQRRSNPQDHHR